MQKATIQLMHQPRRQPAVDHDVRPGDKPRLVAHQEDDGVADVLWRADKAEQYAIE